MKRRRDATRAHRERRKGRRDERREVHQLLFFFRLPPTGRERDHALVGGSRGLKPLPLFLLLLPCQAELTERKREMELPRSFSSSRVPPLRDGVGRWGKSVRSDQRPPIPQTTPSSSKTTPLSFLFLSLSLYHFKSTNLHTHLLLKVLVLLMKCQ